MSQTLLTPGYTRSDGYPVPPPLSGSTRDSLGSSFGGVTPGAGSVSYDDRLSFSPHSREATSLDGRSTPIQLSYRVTLRWPLRAALIALAALLGALFLWWLVGSLLAS